MAGTFYRELRRLLEEAGCTFVRYGKGDHEIWYSPITQKKISLDRGGKARHTANGVLTKAGLPKAF